MNRDAPEHRHDFKLARMTADDALAPYSIFAGLPDAEGPVWSDYSVESTYPTAGQAAGCAATANVSAASAPAQQQGSGRRKKVHPCHRRSKKPLH